MARVPASVLLQFDPPGPHDFERALSALRATLAPADQIVAVGNGLPSVAASGRLSCVADLVAAQRAARHEVVVVLDAAIALTPRWIEPMVRAMADPHIAAAGPRRNDPGPQSVAGAVGLDRKAVRAFARDREAAHRGGRSEVATLAPGCVVLRRHDLGLLLGADGSFPDPGELAGRARATGRILAACDDAYVHVGGYRSARSSDGGPLVSACLIVKDEEANLPTCLASLLPAFVDEVVVYDTGSSDRTVEVARSLGATVIEGYWDDDFARARNAALEHCRGQWIAWLDADESLECEDVNGLRNLLRRTSADIDGWSIPIHNLTGAGVGAGFVHYAGRIFRRRPCRWFGRLHEQIERRDGSPLRLEALDIVHLRHTGYLSKTWDERGKSERNVRIARAQADGGEDTLALLNLARSLMVATRWDDSLGACREVIAGSTNPIERRMALRTGAECLMALQRYEEALAWATQLRSECTNPVQADVVEAQVRYQMGHLDDALACLERVGDGGLDDDGFSHSRPQLASLRAGTLAALGRHGDAADEILACLATNGTMDVHVGTVLGYLQLAGRTPAELALAIPPERGPSFLAQTLNLDPARADGVLEAAVANPAIALAVLATAANLAPRLPLERALVWSARLRAAGHSISCPLIAVATSEAPALDRARAAAVARQMFADERAAGAFEAAVATAGAAELEQIRLEIAAICPGLVEVVPVRSAAAAANALSG